jgi:hypothetical protein
VALVENPYLLPVYNTCSLGFSTETTNPGLPGEITGLKIKEGSDTTCRFFNRD